MIRCPKLISAFRDQVRICNPMIWTVETALHGDLIFTWFDRKSDRALYSGKNHDSNKYIQQCRHHSLCCSSEEMRWIPCIIYYRQMSEFEIQRPNFCFLKNCVSYILINVQSMLCQQITHLSIFAVSTDASFATNNLRFVIYQDILCRRDCKYEWIPPLWKYLGASNNYKIETAESLRRYLHHRCPNLSLMGGQCALTIYRWLICRVYFIRFLHTLYVSYHDVLHLAK